MKGFCGQLYTSKDGVFVGNIYKTSGGYIVREIKPYARKVGPALFNGRVFSGKDFALIRRTDLGYGIDRMYVFAETAQQAA